MENPWLVVCLGFPKNESVDGVDVLRLMDLRPVNSLFQSLVGGMSTLPMLSQLSCTPMRCC